MADKYSSKAPSFASKPAPANRVDAAALLALLVFALVICWPVLLGRVPIASNTLSLWAPWSQLPHEPVRNTTLADSAHLYLSWEVFAREAVHDGEWPMWDPYSFSGFPFAANAQNQVYYPPVWLFWLLPMSGQIQALAVFNLVLAGWGMYFFARVLGTTRVAALIAGLAFGGSGMLQTAVDVPGVASAYGWLPWMLGSSDLALRFRSNRWTAAAALCCGLQMVSGHLQWAVYAYFALGCWLLFRLVQSWIARRGLLRPAVRVVLILLAGPLLALVHLAPFVELTGLSARTGARVSSNSDPLVYLLRLLMPSFFGTPLVIPNFSLGSSNLWYLGLLPLALMVASFWSRWRATATFWFAVAVFCVLVAYGIGPFLYVRWLPGLQATLPVRIGFLLIASLSIMAALGYDAWLAMVSRSRPRSILLFGVMAAVLLVPLVVAALGWYQGSDWVVRGLSPDYSNEVNALQGRELTRAVLLAIVTLAALCVCYLLVLRRNLPRYLLLLVPFALAVDLLSALPGYTPYVDPGAVLPSTPSIAWLKQQPGQWRVMGLGGTAADASTPAFVPNSQLLFGLPSVDGYDSLHPRRYDEYWNLVEGSKQEPGPYANVFVRPQAYSSTLASLLGVRYVAATRPVDTRDVKQVYRDEIGIYENTSALPRAFLVGKGTLAEPAEVLKRLVARDFDPSSEVLIEKNSGTSAIPVEALSGGDSSSPAGQVTITSYRRNEVVVRAHVTRTSWLVLADTNYPGWHAVVDGREQPVYTADHILRSVPLVPGSHEVRFWFQPSSFVPTLAVSALCLLVVLFFLARPGRRESNGPNEAGSP